MAVSLDDRTSVYDYVVRGGNGIKGLVDSGLSEVPKPYIQPQEERIGKLEAIPYDYPPIDLSKLEGPNHAQVVEEVFRASESLGVFQVVNHGMSLELLDSLKQAAHKFHSLPTEKKVVYLGSLGTSPLVKYYTGFLPEKAKALEWKDAVNMAYTCDADAHQYWPEECRSPTLEYVKLSSTMVRKLLVILINKLGATLDDSKLDALMVRRSAGMNFYPPCPDPELTVGSGRHSDASFLTVLLQDEVGGLQVKVGEDIDGKRKGEWMDIPPIPGALVITVGDSLQIISNGRYKSAEHRVRTSKSCSRVPIPFFAVPAPTTKIGPSPELVEEDGGPRYREVIFGDYMNNYFSSPHGGRRPLEFAQID